MADGSALYAAAMGTRRPQGSTPRMYPATATGREGGTDFRFEPRGMGDFTGETAHWPPEGGMGANGPREAASYGGGPMERQPVSIRTGGSFAR